MPSFKSKLEEKVWAVLKKNFPSVKYESNKFKFIQPEIERTYIPDFKTGRSNIFLEAKGKFLNYYEDIKPKYTNRKDLPEFNEFRVIYRHVLTVLNGLRIVKSKLVSK